MINRNQIIAVYSGRPGCACGCRGTHSESPRSITTIVNKMNALDANIKRNGNHFAIETETRLYIAYWTKDINPSQAQWDKANLPANSAAAINRRAMRGEDYQTMLAALPAITTEN